jgi:hypothetical protein
MDKSKLVFIIISTLILAISGCEIFSLRDSEDPQKPAEWNTYTLTPVKTLENLAFSYNYRENLYKYASLFADNFSFNFDSRDISDFHLPYSWNKSSEVDMLMNTYQRIDPENAMSVVFEKINDQNDNIQVNRAWLYRKYTLTVYTSTSGLPKTYSGKMQLYLEKDNTGFWRIKDWNDFRILNNLSWGRMKNEYSL